MANIADSFNRASGQDASTGTYNAKTVSPYAGVPSQGPTVNKPLWDYEKLNIRQNAVQVAKELGVGGCIENTEDFMKVTKAIEDYFWECKLP